MNKQCIIFVSDEKYVSHVMSIAVNCIAQGSYTGDFAVICPRGSGVKEVFEPYGWHVLEVDATGFMAKFYVFDKFFKQWSKVLYLDADILVQGDINKLFDLLDTNPHKIWMDREDGDTLRTLPVDDNYRNETNNADLYAELKTMFPYVLERTFNTSVILFRQQSVPDDTPQRLIELQKRFFALNDPAKGGTDQQIINLLLWNQCKQIPDKLVCYWGLDEPENRVDSEYRGYKEGDVPVAIHMGRHYNSWTKVNDNQGAYFNDRVNRVLFELYHENLAAFDETFKKQL